MLSRFPHILFKDGYGMQRLVQQQFQDRGETFNAALELNTLDAFRGVIRQGNFIALLPQSALADCHDDPTLAVRPTEAPVLTRSVVLVTTRDRLVIPPIQRFHALVQSLATPARPRPCPAAVSYS